MTDHVLFGQTYRVNVLTGSYLSQGNNMATAVQQFHQGYGQLTNPNVDYFGWEKLPRNSSNFNKHTISALNSFPADWPDIEIIAPGGYFGYSQNYITDNPTDSYNYASIVAGLVAPLSRGWVNITSADTADAPLINPNWLTDPTDQAAAIAAFRRTRQIWQSSPMKPLLIGPEYFPGSAVSTDAQILNFIQKSFSTIFHAAVTCRMGPANDPNAVVDPQARVIGVTGVRVVDASSFALLPPGHPMSTVCKSWPITLLFFNTPCLKLADPSSFTRCPGRKDLCFHPSRQVGVVIELGCAVRGKRWRPYCVGPPRCDKVKATRRRVAKSGHEAAVGYSQFCTQLYSRELYIHIAVYGFAFISTTHLSTSNVGASQLMRIDSCDAK